MFFIAYQKIVHLAANKMNNPLKALKSAATIVFVDRYSFCLHENYQS